MTPVTRVRSSFTLLELLAVIAILAMAVGLATIQLPGLAHQAAFEDTAVCIVQTLRLAKADADRSGLPRVVRLSNDRLVIRKPVRGATGWTWKNVGPLQTGRASIEGCRRADESVPVKDPPWEVSVRPGTANAQYLLTLRSSNGQSAVLRVVPGACDYTLTFTDDHEK